MPEITINLPDEIYTRLIQDLQILEQHELEPEDGGETLEGLIIGRIILGME